MRSHDRDCGKFTHRFLSDQPVLAPPSPTVTSTPNYPSVCRTCLSQTAIDGHSTWPLTLDRYKWRPNAAATDGGHGDFILLCFVWLLCTVHRCCGQWPGSPFLKVDWRVTSHHGNLPCWRNQHGTLFEVKGDFGLVQWYPSSRVGSTYGSAV